MPKIIAFEEDARRALERGMDQLAEAVAAEIEHPRHGEVWRARPGPPPAA
jgi:hypothetical protein